MNELENQPITIHTPEQNEVAGVETNLEMMENQMLRFLMNESQGSNAGSVIIAERDLLCGAANCTIDPETGKIQEFSNKSEQPGETVAHCYFKVAGDQHSDFQKIVGFELDRLSDSQVKLSEFALGVIAASIEKFNKNHADETLLKRPAK